MKPTEPTDWKYSNVTMSHHVEKKLDDIFKDCIQTYLLHYRTWLSSAPVAKTHRNSWLAKMREGPILRTEQAITDAASTLIREEMILQNHYSYTFGVLEHSWTTRLSVRLRTRIAHSCRCRSEKLYCSDHRCYELAGIFDAALYELDQNLQKSSSSFPGIKRVRK